MRRVRFEIAGRGRGKDRPRNIHGQVRPYTPANTVEYERNVKVAARHAWPFAPTSNAIAILITVFVMRTESWPNWKHQLIDQGKVYPVMKPDGDNVEKMVWDGLNGIIWKDDVQVVDGRVRRAWRDRPGVLIEVTELDGYPSNIKIQPDTLDLK
jgi:Holliday junction resolvase RusA-like endonuclease